MMQLKKGFGATKSTLAQQLKRNFSRDRATPIHRMFNLIDKQTTAYTMRQNDPTIPLEGHNPLYATDIGSTYRATQLLNGFTVLTESQTFPGAVNMGFLMDVGTRDETMETSGSLLALKNTYLKTLKHTNETVNYGMIQMSGGEMDMDYD